VSPCAASQTVTDATVPCRAAEGKQKKAHAPGATTQTITIEIKGDSKKEASETFYLDLFGNSVNSLFTKNRGLGTILNDD
jgi:hypothetical protein